MKRIALAAAAVLLGLYCDTRVPEEPSDTSTVFPPADRIDLLIGNLHKAIQTLNDVEYIKCFSESSFTYRADPRDSLNDPVKLAGWDRAREADFITAFTDRYSGATLPQTDFDPDAAIDEQDTLVENILFKIPRLDISLGDSLLPGEIRVLVDLVVKKGNDDLYYIHRWEEERSTDSGDSLGSWAQVKAEQVN